MAEWRTPQRILNLGTRRRCVTRFTVSPQYPWKERSLSIEQVAARAAGRVDDFETKKKNLYSFRESNYDSSVVQPVADTN